MVTIPRNGYPVRNNDVYKTDKLLCILKYQHAFHELQAIVWTEQTASSNRMATWKTTFIPTFHVRSIWACYRLFRYI